MPIISRINEIIIHLSKGRENPDVALAMEHMYVPISGVIKILEAYRDTLAKPNLRVGEVSRFGGLGRYMMEDMGFCDTKLGKDILYLNNHIITMHWIDKALIIMEQSFGQPVEKSGWKELYYVIIAMKNTFDDEWYPNESELSQLRKKMALVIKEFHLDTTGSELGNILYYLY